jgi:hypothetical protein
MAAKWLVLGVVVVLLVGLGLYLGMREDSASLGFMVFLLGLFVLVMGLGYAAIFRESEEG